MLISRDVSSSFSSCSGIRMKLSYSLQMVASGGTAAVYCKVKPSPRVSLLRKKVENWRNNDATMVSKSRVGSLHYGFMRVEVESDFSDGMVASRRRRSLGVMVLRAQQSRFFKQYTWSSQDKIERLVKTLCPGGNRSMPSMASGS